MMCKFAYVVVNYNGYIHSKRLKDSIKSMINAERDILVIVDNNSTKTEVDLLKTLDGENTNVIFLKNNIGYFNALNRGLAFVKKKNEKFDFIVIGNNDLVFPNDFRNQVLSKKSLWDKYPVISPNVITMDGEHQNPHVIKEISKTREFIYDLYYCNYFFAKLISILSKITHKFSDRNDETYHQFSQEIYQGHGSCFILGSIFISSIQYLNAPTHLMYEEYFLSKQLQENGHKIFYESSIIVKHNCHSAISKVPKKKMWKISKESHKEYRKNISIWRKT